MNYVTSILTKTLSSAFMGLIDLQIFLSLTERKSPRLSFVSSFTRTIDGNLNQNWKKGGKALLRVM